MRFKVLLVILFFIHSFHSFSQEKEIFSIGVDMNYYYFLGGNAMNPFNYGLLLLGSHRVDKFKVSSGIGFLTQDSYHNTIPDASNFLEKRYYNLEYINLPVLLSYTVYLSNKYKTDILGGVIFDRIIRYDITSYYSNKSPIVEKNIDVNKKNGSSFRLGLGISKYINQRTSITLSVFSDLKVRSREVNYRPSYDSLSQVRLSLGLGLGIEYVLNE